MYLSNKAMSLERSSFSENNAQKNYKPARAMRLALGLLESLKKGSLSVVLPDGTLHGFKGSEAGPKAEIHIHNDRVAKRFLRRGKLGFCEAYLDEEWSSPDMTALFTLFLVNGDAMKHALMGGKWTRALSYIAHRLKPNSRKGSKKNIHTHYDIGNDFYKAWLDPGMSYSAAYFADGITDLKEAQDRKYEEMVRRLDLKAEHHLLEIGCGWGGFAEYAARCTGCKVTAVTISRAQYRYAKNRIQKAGLTDRVEIRLEDYRDIKGQFDRIGSIEMFEAVGEKYWPVFFDKTKSLLKPGGTAVLQIITIRDEDFTSYRKSGDYIQRYIFLGGMLPSKAVLSKKIKAHGFIEGDRLCFGKDYGHTLKLWHDAFQAAWPHLKSSQGFDNRFKRMWEQYLCYCEAGFNAGAIDVVHQSFHKPE